MAIIRLAANAILAIQDISAKRKSTSASRILVNTTVTARILLEVIVVAVCREHLERIVKLTSTNVTAILVETAHLALMALTNTLVSAWLASREFIAKRTSTNVLQIHARMEEFASTSLTALNASVQEVITMLVV